MAYEVKDKNKTSAIAEKSVAKCLLCGGEMKLVMTDKTSWWQCEKDLTHRMSLTEWSSLRDDGGTEEKVIAAMKERQVTIQAQMK